MKEKKNGFTLVEIIVVIAILIILIAALIPSFSVYIDEAGGTSAITNARQAYTASVSGLIKWKAAGSPGNGDRVYKKNIEQEIVKYLGLDRMSSFENTGDKENSVQVALSLPSYFSQGWESFLNECSSNEYRNFVRVWVGKNPDRTVGDSIKGIYYISADGKYAARIVYDAGTKLGAADNRFGSYYQRID